MPRKLKYLGFLLLLLIAFNASAQDFYRWLPNQGQWEDPVKYRTQVDGTRMYLVDDGVVFNIRDYSEISHLHGKPSANVDLDTLQAHFHAYKMSFVGGTASGYEHQQPSSEYYNFIQGSRPDQWKGKIYGYGEVRTQDIWPGIDLKFYTESHQMKYDFIVQPGSDPSQIQLEFEGQDGLEIDRKGQLIIQTSLGNVIEMKPYAFQVVNGTARVVPCNFKLDGSVLSYEFPEGYHKHAELVIDPTLIFSTSSGSTADNFGMTATYDDQGNLISGGTVFDDGFPTTLGAYDITFSGTPGTGITDVILTKYNATGTNQIYSTYVGGQQCETVHSLIMNDAQELFFFGVTSSSDFPITAGAYDNTFDGGTVYQQVANGTFFNFGTDMYVGKLSDDGTALLASTFIGGSANDGINYPDAQNYDSLQFNYGDQFRGEVMIDDLGNCYVASCTKSSDFPIVNGYGSTFGGGQAGVVFKFDPNLTNLEWSTYLNGQNKDAAYSLKVNEDYEVYVSGGTTSPNFPTTPGAYQTAFQGGEVDGFIAHISDDGSALLHSTLLGTNAYDQAYFVEIDRFGDVHLVGQTLGSATFPTTSGVYINPTSGQFISSLDSTLATLKYSTLFGNGNGVVNISPAAFLVDNCGNIYVSGWGGGIGGSNQQASALNGMPITPDAAYSTPPNGYDFYLIVFERQAQGLLYGSYFGGNLSSEHVDGGTSRFDPNGVVYQSVCAGCGGNSDFPSTPGAWSPTNLSTNCNNGVFKLDFEILPVADFTVSTTEICAPDSITFTNNSINNTNFLWDFGNGDTTSIDISPTRPFLTPGTFTVTLTIEDTICQLLDTAIQIVEVRPELFLNTSNGTLLCEPAPIDLWASGTGHDGNYVWSTNPNFTDTLNTPLTDSSITVNPIDSTWYYVMIENPGCSLMDSVLVDFTSGDLNLPSQVDLCIGESDVVTVVYTDPLDPIQTIDWSADSIITGGDGTNSVQIEPSSTQYLYVDITTSLGCTFFDSVLVDVTTFGGTISAYADDDTLQYGDTTQLHALPGGLSYTWAPAGDLDNPNSQDPFVVPSTVGWNQYVVSVGSGNCVQTAIVRIFTYEIECGPPYIYVPNAFTPNGDGNNDILKVYGNNLEDFYFAVYDRWGELMFETTDPTQGWDGTLQGKECDPAVYVYYLDATCVDKQTFFEKGNVTLIR